MENKLSIPLLNITFKVNELHNLLHEIELSSESKDMLENKITEIHKEINYVHNNRVNIVDELYKLANNISITIK
jgi:predicted  nucleic acid-binding Zn-ribbon protein